MSPALAQLPEDTAADVDVVGHPERLAGVPVRIDCGRGDPFYPNVEERICCIFLNCIRHLFKHIKCLEPIFYQRIALSICLHANPLTQLIHIIDIIHPFAVDRI